MSAILITPHAHERMAQMGLTAGEVRAAVTDPEVEYGSDGRRVSQAGGVAVVYEFQRGRRVVITVLPRTQEDYVRPDAEDCCPVDEPLARSIEAGIREVIR